MDHGHDHHHSHSHAEHGHHHHSHSHAPHKHRQVPHTHPTLLKIAKAANIEAFGMDDQRFLGYFLGVGSMMGISFISFCLLSMLPFGTCSTDAEQKAQAYRLSLLVSFAVGALLGDAFLHLIPSALGVHSHGGDEHEHEHEHHEERHSHAAVMIPALSIVGGLLLFFTVAKMMRACTDGHGHAHGQIKEDAAAKGPKKGKKTLQPAAFLNTIADMVHNFTDGLALGTSWSRSTALGISTSLAVLFHEIPHELGDMGILIKSGATKWQALGINSISGLCATAGAAVGVYLQHSPAFANHVLPVTAGGFIYVAMAEMMPQLQETPTLLHSVGIALGILLMACVTLLE